jgi:hypothetical protein
MLLENELAWTFFRCSGKEAKDVPFLSSDIKILYMWAKFHTYNPPPHFSCVEVQL